MKLSEASEKVIEYARKNNFVLTSSFYWQCIRDYYVET